MNDTQLETSNDTITSDEEIELSMCCMGAAARGPEHCTCWEPVYDQPQEEPKLNLEPLTRTKCCDDCAYRNDSPEKLADGGDHLFDIAAHNKFWCHKGMRRVVQFNHPSGRVKIPQRDDYVPLIQNGIAYKANGEPADLCSGWHATRQGILNFTPKD